MIFRKMKLHNFRQFKGDNEIEFSLDKEKNVTVLVGKNRAGKTTLLQAFNWCLYNQVKLENPEEIITNEVIHKLDIGESAYVQVSLEFEHANKIYTCKNRRDYIRNEQGNIKKIDESQTYDISDPETGETKRTTQSAIREVFPKDLSTYFLFDGERMEEVADNSKAGKKDLSTAVKNLLGLDVLEQTNKDLGKVKKEFESELVSDNSSRLDEINEKLKYYDEALESEKKNKDRYEDELSDLNKKLKEINNTLMSFASLKELQKKRLEYNDNMQRLNNEIERKKYDIFRGFGSCAMNFFLGPTFDKVYEKIKGANLSDKAIEGINAMAIDAVIKRKTCICGLNLEEHKEAVDHLLSLRKLLPPENYSVLLKEVEMDINHAEENNEAYYNNFKSMYNEYNELINQKDLLNDKISENEKLISETGDRDLSKFNEDYKEIKEKVDSKNRAIGSCNLQIENIKDDIKKLENERSQLTVSNNLNDVVNFKISVCENLIDKVSKRLNEKEAEVKKDLQIKTSELLSTMLDTSKYITIGDDYNFSVSDEYHTTALSTGEKIVVSFAFVGSIISIAKEFISKDKDGIGEGIGDDKFTLVMDAPFATLDEQNSENVTSTIPKLTDQVILFTVDKQWKGIVKDTLMKQVGVLYDIEKDNTVSKVKLVSKVV